MANEEKKMGWDAKREEREGGLSTGCWWREDEKTKMNEEKIKNTLWGVSFINQDGPSAPATLSGASFTRRMPSLIAGQSQFRAVMRGNAAEGNKSGRRK